MEFFAKLKDFMGKGGNAAKPGTLGSGAANKAATAMHSRAYKLYAAEAQAMGETPMSPEAFAAKMPAKKSMLF